MNIRGKDPIMEAILYAEIYLICIFVVSVLLYWISRRDDLSLAERWIKRVYICFICNFGFNLLFTVFNRIWVIDHLANPLSYLFKSLYLFSLVLGVLCWVGYAEAYMYSGLLSHRWARQVMGATGVVLGALIIANLFVPLIFSFGGNYEYRRHIMFPIMLGALAALSGCASWRLLTARTHEADPTRKANYALLSTFPICLLLALALTQLGESFPVICVCIMLELLSVFAGNSLSQISTDQLTRVNNRQNLDRFVNYKLMDHEGQIWFMMLDVDRFKPINDTFGHLEGDMALKKISRVLKAACQSIPSRPFIARYGGDEFAILVEGTEQDCQMVQRQISEQLEAENTPDRPYRLEVSIGVAKYLSGMTYLQLVAEADSALYRIKAQKKAARAASAG